MNSEIIALLATVGASLLIALIVMCVLLLAWALCSISKPDDDLEE